MPELNENVEPKVITKKQFEDAYNQVAEEMMNDDKLQGMNKLIVPLLGSRLADKMKKILFDNKEEN